MFKKLRKSFGWLNEHHFNSILLALSCIATWLTFVYENAQLQILSLLMLRVSLYLFIGSIFITFLNGVGCNIKDEIFDQENIAAGILTAGFWIGLAIAIAVSI